ncbi:MAG: flagellar motor switch protein FliM [Pseudomonadota bacterium]
MAETEDPELNSELAADWARIMESDDLANASVGTSLESKEAKPDNDRDEIDSLLGIGKTSRNETRSGMLALVNNNDVSYERLPMLEVVFDRFERILTTSLRNFTSENVDTNVDNIIAQRFGDYLNSVPLPAMIAVFRAKQWDNFGLITIDGQMIFGIVEVLLGGRRGATAARVEGRPYTTIEASLVERLVRLILDDLTAAFGPITEVEFQFERIETNPRFAAITRPSNACVVMQLRIDMQDRGGTVEFVLPYATLEPARELLIQKFMGERLGRDSIWENHLARELLQTDLEVSAVLYERLVSLREISQLKIGSTINLSMKSDALVELRCSGTPMMEGKVGRKGNRLAITIEHRSDERSEVVNV